jgi:hypothetical protein
MKSKSECMSPLLILLRDFLINNLERAFFSMIAGKDGLQVDENFPVT